MGRFYPLETGEQVPIPASNPSEMETQAQQVGCLQATGLLQEIQKQVVPVSGELYQGWLIQVRP